MAEAGFMRMRGYAASLLHLMSAIFFRHAKIQTPIRDLASGLHSQYWNHTVQQTFLVQACYFLNVIDGFRVVRNSSIAQDGVWARIVGGYGKKYIAGKHSQEMFQVGDATGDILLGIENVFDSEFARNLRD